MRFTPDEKLTLILALNFWIENVAQEDTDKGTFIQAHELRNQLKKSVERSINKPKREDHAS